LDDAYRLIAKGVALCRDWNVADILGLSLIELAYIHQSLGAYEKASKALKEAANVLEDISSWGSKIATAHRVKLDLARGDIESAEGWAQTNDLDIDGDYEHYREIEYLVLARVLIAQEKFKEAYSLVERIFRIAREIGKRQTELETLILLSIVCSSQGETDQALDYLEKALLIGEPQGYIRIFVDEGPPMASLLYEALKREISPAYAQRLLAAFPVTETEQTPERIQVDDSEWIEPLSEREIEVLQLLAKGLTNQAVADRLVLSIHTVKAHTRSIYSKLAVNNRTQAVDRARTLGVLPPN
jgi:LuxR family maltose regulon positive regulatory protein